MQRFGRRIDAAVGRAMHGQRADTHPQTQWAEAAFVPARGKLFGKKWYFLSSLAACEVLVPWDASGKIGTFFGARDLALDDFVTGEESSPKRSAVIDPGQATGLHTTTDLPREGLRQCRSPFSLGEGGPEAVCRCRKTLYGGRASGFEQVTS
ncbi:MAG: hypothetical protein ACOY3N_02755 [Bradyrhizobium sp.]|jgi:hypothetical protein|uniref:hypothetical protein n=1 Tax=Bradyrhizobium TaxID=374 RepID=UPI0012BB8FA3|nr:MULTISPECIES: hypothetical protein [Bradyrhizobium]